VSEPSAIAVTDLVKGFSPHPRPILNGVTFTVAPGEFVVLMGPSGSGKSTLLNLLAALDRPDSGTIMMDGEDLTTSRRLTRHRRYRIGLVFQLHNLLAHLTASQNVQAAMFGTRVRPGTRRQRAEELLDRLQMAEFADRKPPELSGGERQRVAIARALANDPPILLADEPTGNLDDDSAAHVMALLQELAADGRTILVVTHDARIAAEADRTLRLAGGRIEPVQDVTVGR
jgi:putative ABC transport system ATP-binding protein